MKAIRIILFAGFFILYGCVFTMQDQKAQTRKVSLEFVFPVNFYRIVSGYFKQLTAEILFIRTSVFLGGNATGTDLESYEDTLVNNFEVMTSLYPRFIDPYFFCQSSLTRISINAAKQANTILATAISALPNEHHLRFFYASNYFLWMNEPIKAGKAFAKAAELPDAPPIFAHLAAILSAKGGDLVAGLISLKTLMAGETNESSRARYSEEIVIFEKAIVVQKALDQYEIKYGTSPNSLDRLVPEFLPRLPVIKDFFNLVYDPPKLRLERPDRKKNSPNSENKSSLNIPFYLKP